MLREEYLPIAASVHAFGTRFLRDSAACLFPCCTLNYIRYVFDIRRSIDVAEQFMSRSVKLCEGLMERSTITKYTSLTEARTALMGVNLDRSLTGAQIAAEKKTAVPPGTRADVYDGYISLSSDAVSAVAEFTSVCDKISDGVRAGELAFAVPLPIVAFLRRLCADYGAACSLLAQGEKATLLCRKDDADNAENSLRHYVCGCGVDVSELSLEDLAARAGGGLIGGIPAVIFDILLRYRSV